MSIDLKDLARLGAQTRLVQLAAEMDALHRAFPGLGATDKKRGRPRKTASAAPDEQVAGKRKPMSVAAKKAVGERMRAYWKKRKGTATVETTPETKPKAEKTAPKKRKMSAAGRAAISAAQKKRWAAKKR